MHAHATSSPVTTCPYPPAHHLRLPFPASTLIYTTTSLPTLHHTSFISQFTTPAELENQPTPGQKRLSSSSQNVQLQRQVRGRRPDRRPPGVAAGGQPRGGAGRRSPAQEVPAEVALHAGFVRQCRCHYLPGRAARARQHPRAGGGLSPATYYAGFGHCESDKGGWRQGGGGGRVRGEEQDEGQESRRRAAGGDICGAGRVRARREHRGGAARARRAGAGAAQEADRALRPHRVLLPCRGKSRRHSHGGRRARPCLPHRARRETLQLHHALLRPAVCRVPRRGVGSARARRRVAVRDAHLVRRASRGRLDFHPEEKTPLQGGVLRLQRGCGHQIHGEADRGAERGLRAGLGHRQRDRQQRLPDSRGAEGLRFVGQVCVGVREQQAAVAELQVQPEDPSEDVQVGVHQQGHGPARLPLRRPHRHPLLHAGRRPHQRSPRLLPAPPCLLLRRPRKLIF